MGEVICRNCGHRNQEGANFCSSCGQAIERGDDPTTMTFTLDTDPGAEVPAGVAASAFGSLAVTRGPNTGSAFELEHVITTVGRHPDSDIFLDDVTVSRRHVEVERTPTGTVVRDVGELVLEQRQDLADRQVVGHGRSSPATYTSLNLPTCSSSPGDSGVSPSMRCWLR